MLLSKLRVATVVMLGIGLVGAGFGAGGLAAQDQTREKTGQNQQLLGVPPGIPAVAANEAQTKAVVVRENAAMREVAWSADGRLVVTVSTATEVVGDPISSPKDPRKLLMPHSTVKIWDARTGTLVKSLGDEKKTEINAIAFSPDQKNLAIAGRSIRLEDGHHVHFMRILDTKTWAAKQEVTDADVPPANTLVFSPDSKTLAMGGAWDRTEKSSVWFWDVQREQLRRGTRAVGAAKPIKEKVKTGARPGTAAIPSKEMAKTGVPVAPEADPSGEREGAVWSLAFSPPDGRLLAGVEYGRSRTARIQLYDGKTGELKRQWDIGEGNWIPHVAFTADGMNLVSAHGSVKIWDVDTGREVRTLDSKGWMTSGVAVSPDGRHVAAGGSKIEKEKLIAAGTLLWDAKTGELKQTVPWQDPSMWTSSLAFSPDGKSLGISGMTGADVRVKDSEKTKGELRLVPLDH